MRIGRTQPPAASPIPLADIIRALPACFSPNAKNNRFETQVRQEYGVKHCFLVSSGKAALTLCLLALKEIYPGRDQVILPAYTCYSVPAAVKRAGVRVCLCDLQPASLDLDKEKLAELVDGEQQERILCVIPTHLFGCPADVDGIREITGTDIPLIEDAAQAMGESIEGRKLGTLGDIGFFSLGRGKALSTMEGGIIVTDRDDVADAISSLSGRLKEQTTIESLRLAVKALLTTILQRPFFFWLPKALPFLRLGETFYEPDFPLQKLSSFQVTLARNWQRRLRQHRRTRIKNVSHWQKKASGDFIQLCKVAGAGLVRFPILVRSTEQRDYILRKSEQLGLGLMRAYPTTVNRIPEIEDEFAGQKFPRAEDVCKYLLTIPVHEYLTDFDFDKMRF